MKSLTLACTLIAVAAHAATLPGFRVERIAATSGFASSIVVDSQKTIYYTTTDGNVFRVSGTDSILVAHVVTDAIGNSGLLGMALVDDRTAIVHYTTISQTYDVISGIDLTTGREWIVEQFVCDIGVPERGSSSEHHGGNPIVGSDGSILVGIGDYGGGLVASLPDWNGGKIFRIEPNGLVVQFARGLRNPFDLIWDAAKQRVIVADNGPATGDDLNIVSAGANLGWPFTFAGTPPTDGVLAPIYVFKKTVAPTGTIALNGANPMLPSGVLIGAYVTKAIYFFPDIDAYPLPDPIALISKETDPVIDVAQSQDGDIVFVTGSTIYRLIVPIPGDCNGDGRLNGSDLDALEHELADAPEVTYGAQGGSYAGSWGCDANGDGRIDTRDRDELIRIAGPRRRAARSAR